MARAGRVIVVGNEKGGCGKTTLAVNLAASAASQGRDVLLVDADPGQQSAARWSERRRTMHPDSPAVMCFALTGNDVRLELKDMAARYQVVIVDTGAEDSPQLRAAATVANVLLVPTQPDEFDLWTLPTMSAVWEGAHAYNRNLRAVLAVNRVSPRSAEGVQAYVASFLQSNVPKLAKAASCMLIGRNAYGRASGEGLGVAEVKRDRDAKAVFEFNSLYTEVMG